MKKILLIFLVLICSNANSSEIVKEVNAKSNTFLDGCGLPYVKFTFYSNGKSEETITCPETKKIKKYNGVWEDLSSRYDLPKLDFIEIIYPNGLKRYIDFKTDSIRATLSDKGIEVQKIDFVYTDEEYNEKEKSKVEKKKSNENPKDLSGNAIDCNKIQDYFKSEPNTKFHTQATILFKTNNKAKFAISKFKKVSGKIELFDILIPGEIVNYKVLDKKIVLKIDGIKNVYDPLGNWRKFANRKESKGEIWILRETLELTNLKGWFYDIKCKLVDANDIQLFDKYYEFQKTLNKKLQKQKKDSESRNIL